MSAVFLVEDNDKMEQTQSEKIQVVVKNMNGNGILLQNAKGISLKSVGAKAEYFLQVDGQDGNVDIQPAQFVAIENECVEGEEVDSQFVPLEMVEEGQIIIQDKDVILWDELCRICANTSDKVVPIFSGEGLEHNLCKKIQSYLPLTVSETDTLPLQVCYNCTATLLAWHEMTQNCLSAQDRLTELQNKLNSKNQEQSNVSDGDVGEIIDNETEMEATSNQEDQVQVEADEQNVQEAEHAVDESEIDRVQSFSYMCGVCEATYAGELELMRHMRAAHRERARASALSYECDVCARAYATKSKLVRHIRMHERGAVCARKSGDRGEDAAVESSKVFCRRSHRLLFKCELEGCGALLKTRRGFLRHMRVHRDVRPVICEHCGKTYRIEDDLKRHIDDVHRKIKRHQCDVCGRYFAAKGTRDAHRRIHTQEKPFPCPECGKHFRSISLLGIHRRIHKDLRPFKCSYCPMAFREKQKCQHHEAAIHTKCKPYECDMCDRRFAAKGELNRHRSVHFPDQKPYVCAKCEMGFRLTRYLRNHIKRHHAKDAEDLLKDLERK